MIKIVLLIGITVLLFARGYDVPENRSQAKKLIKMIHLDYKTTLLNDCQYIYDPKSCMDITIVDTATCSVKQENQRMQWIQVVPDTFYGRTMACMNKDICVSEFTGKAYRGNLCCRQTNAEYRKMEADLFNLIPVVSAIAEQQEGKPFGEVEKPTSLIGKVKIDSNYIEPPDELKGDIARVYLYMDQRYELHLSTAEKEMFQRWHKLDAVDARECAIAKIIMKVQGANNDLLIEGCK
ncbi:MAG: endonuclease [Helicobacteraceae bacterium]|nr:endonuclease [Helicobacteraceae bacterium]